MTQEQKVIRAKVGVLEADTPANPPREALALNRATRPRHRASKLSQSCFTGGISSSSRRRSALLEGDRAEAETTLLSGLRSLRPGRFR